MIVNRSTIKTNHNCAHIFQTWRDNGFSRQFYCTMAIRSGSMQLKSAYLTLQGLDVCSAKDLVEETSFAGDRCRNFQEAIGVGSALK